MLEHLISHSYLTSSSRSSQTALLPPRPVQRIRILLASRRIKYDIPCDILRFQNETLRPHDTPKLFQQRLDSHKVAMVRGSMLKSHALPKFPGPVVTPRPFAFVSARPRLQGFNWLFGGIEWLRGFGGK